MEKQTIVLGIVIGLIIGIIGSTGFYIMQAESIAQEINMTMTNYENTISEKENEIIKLEEQLVETTENEEYASEMLQKEKTKQRQTAEIARTCYWASSFGNDKENTIEHYSGEDLTEYYYYNCESNAGDNWELIKDE